MSTGEQSLFFLFNVNGPARPRESGFIFDKLKVCSMGQPFDFKKRNVVASCFQRRILVTEVVLLQTMKLPTTAA